MKQVKIEMIIEGEEPFQYTVEFETAQLMMHCDYLTVNMNTVRVHAKEVTDKGRVKFYGVRRKPEEFTY
ncbi:hypothetical protein GKZ89_00315 [Bacillus mangrovi]|uniref:Uncharacterized protein n=1 Tax=Metabacillus mangrovi TaxID=1491830 RepID=A0A7X2S180_9BACI|nr:hypothetical protein [Metabacillus mangrovi]MTH51830.1 hypothetical protein [Metabacillus mangrovi]